MFHELKIVIFPKNKSPAYSRKDRAGGMLELRGGNVVVPQTLQEWRRRPEVEPQIAKLNFIYANAEDN